MESSEFIFLMALDRKYRDRGISFFALITCLPMVSHRDLTREVLRSHTNTAEIELDCRLTTIQTDW